MYIEISFRYIKHDFMAKHVLDTSFEFRVFEMEY